MPHRIDNTLLRFLPRRELVCMPIGDWVSSSIHAACLSGMQTNCGAHLKLTANGSLSNHQPYATFSLLLTSAGVKAWIVGAASQGVRSVGSTLKLGAGWVAETAGKVTAGKGGAGSPSASAFAADAQPPGDFSIAAGRRQAGGGLGALQFTESAWDQVGWMDGGTFWCGGVYAYPQLLLHMLTLCCCAIWCIAVCCPRGRRLASSTSPLPLLTGTTSGHPPLQAVRQLASGATIQEVVDREMRSIFGNEFDHVGGCATMWVL